MVARRWNLSSNIQMNSSRVSVANEWDIGFEHETMNFIFPSCLLYKPTNYNVFDDFPTISDHFPKNLNILKVLSEGRTNDSEHFRILPKITEDCRGRSKDGLTNIDKLWQTLQADWSKMIAHMCTYHFYPHTCDTIFIDFLPLAIPLQFIW